MEHPLNSSVEQDGVVEVGDLAIEPEVNAGDGRGFEVGELIAQGRGFRALRQHALEAVEGQSENQIVERLFPVALVLAVLASPLFASLCC